MKVYILYSSWEGDQEDSLVAVFGKHEDALSKEKELNKNYAPSSGTPGTDWKASVGIFYYLEVHEVI